MLIEGRMTVSFNSLVCRNDSGTSSRLMRITLFDNG